MKTFLSVKQLAFSDVVRTLLAYLYPHQWWDKVPTYFTFNSISNSQETDNRYVQLTKRKIEMFVFSSAADPFSFKNPLFEILSTLFNLFRILVLLLENIGWWDEKSEVVLTHLQLVYPSGLILFQGKCLLEAMSYTWLLILFRGQMLLLLGDY